MSEKLIDSRPQIHCAAIIVQGGDDVVTLIRRVEKVFQKWDSLDQVRQWSTCLVQPGEYLRKVIIYDPSKR